MPLEEGTSPETVSANIKEMRESGHPEAQAVAAAENEKRESEQDGYDANSYTTNSSTATCNSEDSHMPRDNEVKEEVKKVVEKKDAAGQTTGQGEEMPSWAAAFSQKLDSLHSRIDELAEKTKGGVPEVEDGQEGTERTAVAKDALGEPAESAANGPEAAQKFAEAERAETRGEAQFAGQGESPVTASQAEQERLQRSREAGPEKSDLDPRLEDGVDRFNTQGQRRDESRKDFRGHDPEKVNHHGREDRMDALYRKLENDNKEMRALLTRAMKQPSIEDRNAIAAARKRADGVYAALGKQTPEVLPGESPMAFRHRLADGLKEFSTSLKKTVMDALPDDVFNTIEEHVYADALEASKKPIPDAPLTLRPHTYQDTTGHTVTEYFGNNLAWMVPFMSAGVGLKVNRHPGKAIH